METCRLNKLQTARAPQAKQIQKSKSSVSKTTPNPPEQHKRNRLVELNKQSGKGTGELTGKGRRKVGVLLRIPQHCVDPIEHAVVLPPVAHQGGGEPPAAERLLRVGRRDGRYHVTIHNAAFQQAGALGVVANGAIVNGL